MIGDTVIFLIKYIGVSAAIRLIYLLLFKGKASYTTQRVLLLTAPLLAFFAALISIDAISVNVDTSSIPLIQSGKSFIQELDNFYAEASISNAPILTSEKVAYGASLIEMLTFIWIGICAYVFLKYINGVRSIFKIKRLSSKAKVDDYPLYRSGLVETPFSFWRSIFVNRVMDGEKFDVIVHHEKAHISNYHYIDKLIMEIYKSISWFNPFIWINYKDLCSVHEFQADQAVINGYCKPKAYKQFLFEEAGFAVPNVANGFNNSLIKQRFIVMRDNYKVTYKFCRRVLTVPLLLLIFALTSCIYVEGSGVNDSIRRNSSYIETKVSEIKKNLTSDRSIITEEEQLSAIEKEQLAWKKAREEGKIVHLERDQYELVDIGNETGMFFLYRYDDRTELVYIDKMSFDSQWVTTSSDYAIVDMETGDRYMAHSMAHDLPFDKLLIIGGQKGKNVMTKTIFPPLPKHLKRVMVEERNTPEQFVPANTAGNFNFVTNVLDGNSKKPYNIINEGGRIIRMSDNSK